MSDDFSITISGLDETLAAMDRLPRTVLKRAIAKGLEAAQGPIMEELRLRTPFALGKDELRELTKSGDMAVYQHLRDAVMGAITMTDEGGLLEIGFGKLGNVANWVEYGHRMVGHGATAKDRKRGYEGKLIGKKFVPPHPFMGIALAAASDRALEVFAEAVNAYIDSNETEVAA